MLVIDDEELIVRACLALLSGVCDVTATQSAEEGLARIAAGECFDAVLCDLVMPSMTGLDFHTELRRMRPDLADRIVFMTGGVPMSEVAAALERLPNRRVGKPFDAAELRSLLGSSNGG